MQPVTQMNKEIFKEHLLETIQEISSEIGLTSNDYRFTIEPVTEPGKALNSADDMMRLHILSEDNIGAKQLSLSHTVYILCGLEPLVPIWVNVSFFGMDEATVIFKLQCSLRFRKPTLLRNVETGHAPFKAIIEKSSF